jgi:hypothetical protein
MGRPRRARSAGESQTSQRMLRLVQYLRLRPEKSFTTGWLQVETGMPRQSVAIALEALRAGGVVAQEYDAGQQLTTWRWVGSQAAGGEGQDPAASREGPPGQPKSRLPASEDEREYRSQMKQAGSQDDC